MARRGGGIRPVAAVFQSLPNFARAGFASIGCRPPYWTPPQPFHSTRTGPNEELRLLVGYQWSQPQEDTSTPPKCSRSVWPTAGQPARVTPFTSGVGEAGAELAGVQGAWGDKKDC